MGARVIAVEPQPVCVDYLRKTFAGNDRVTILDQAIGTHPGSKVMWLNSANPTISTLSDEEWRDQINEDAHYPVEWDDRIEVTVTTLDQLIAEFGMPVFCKIDVENYEYEALLGLSQPLPCLSIEYYPPRIAKAIACLGRLAELGDYRYNWSLRETMRLKSAEWIDYERIVKILEGYSTRYQYGDVYAQLRTNFQGA